MSLLQIRSGPVSPGLPSMATLLFNQPSRGTLPTFSRPPIGCDNDKSNHSALIRRQSQAIKNVDISLFTHRVNCSSVARRWRTLDAWNCSRAWIRWSGDYKGRSYKIKSNEGWILNQQDEEKCECQPNISRICQNPKNHKHMINSINS